jgi:phosphonate transport system substrate-binding protein
VILLLVAAAGGYYFYERARNPEPPPVDELKELKGYLTRLAANQKLAPEYADANPKDLVADAPTDPAKLAKVGDEVTFSVVGTDDPEKAAAEWKDFMAALGQATGKKVRYFNEVSDVEGQLAAVRDGRLHVTAFNTGAVPTAVNTAGFVPLFAAADAGGKYSYEMEIVVRADSPIKDPKELKGKTVGFVALSSNSGAKAPMVDLKEKFGLLPGRDYKFTITGGHDRSLKALGEKKFDAACVANDLYRREVAAGRVDAAQFRSIHTSAAFPPLCFGVPHHLPPDVRTGVEKAFTGFAFTPATPGASQGKVKFVAVGYEKDWEYVRKIDDTLSHLLDGQ